jgi:hypothetical protein
VDRSVSRSAMHPHMRSATALRPKSGREMGARIDLLS